jgi:hypothetical protein
VLKKIFWSQRHEIAGGWKRLHNQELHEVSCSASIVWVIKSRMRWTRHVVNIVQGKGAYRVLVKKYEGQGPLRRTDHRGEKNIQWIFKK